MDIFFEIHSDLPREAPGDDASTRRAFSMLTDLPAAPRILDIGCGPGMQTLALAALTSAPVIALDTHQPFLLDLSRRAARAGLEQQVVPLRMSMFDLGFASGSFDVLWSEGAIYFIGFERGLQTFRRLLKPGGYLAATELCWLKPNPPAEIKAYWGANEPNMKTLEANRQAIQDKGYAEVGLFTLPDSCWMEGYYLPIEERLLHLRRKYAGDLEALRQLEENQLEVDMYRKYSAWYGYVFYVIRKRS
jgi:SAM-dependent methyltransferase